MKKYIPRLIWGILLAVLQAPVISQVSPQGRFLPLNGVDQYLTIPNHPHFNIRAGESFTMTCRVCPSNFGDHYRILSKGNLLLSDGGYEWTTAPYEMASNVSLNIRNSDYTNLGASSVAVLRAGTWAHLAWVFNAADKSLRVYVNGEAARTIFSWAIGHVPVENGYNLMVGCGWTDGAIPERTQFWPGQIDELRIWKRALSGSEIGSDAVAPQPSATGLVAAWDFERMVGNQVPDASGNGHTGELTGYGVRVVKPNLPAGMGNKNERLAGFRIPGGPQGETLTSVSFDLTGTDNLSALTGLRIYYNGGTERFNAATAVPFAMTSQVGLKSTLNGSQRLQPGDNWFWLTGDISRTAIEGTRVGAVILSYTTDGRNTVSVPEVKGTRTILLAHSQLFSGGDDGSKHYRIPAIVTAPDGSLVTATDKRLNSPHDLPNHIDVVVRRSTDNGRTWSRPLTIAGDGVNSGFGDPALAVNQKTGEIICLFAGDKGFFTSTSAEPIRIYQSVSSDNGISWTSPKEITNQVYGAESVNPATRSWQGAFVSSGSFTQLRNGRLMAVLSVRETTVRAVSNYILYSDDHAKSWKVMPYRAVDSGSEAKVAELDFGGLLMSIRNSPSRLFTYSKDNGMSWGVPFLQRYIADPACNGDLVRYTSIVDGYNKNRLLHSIPLATNRSNVSVLLSYDDGSTWPVKRTICAGPSAYSSLCVLPDGTIGIYYESGEYETYEMNFARFSLKWLSGGRDSWTGRYRGILNSSEIASVPVGRLTVYPNPAEGTAWISGNLKANEEVLLFSMGGSLVRTVRADQPGVPLAIPLDGLAPGIYLLRTREGSARLVVR